MRRTMRNERKARVEEALEAFAEEMLANGEKALKMVPMAEKTAEGAREALRATVDGLERLAARDGPPLLPAEAAGLLEDLTARYDTFREDAVILVRFVGTVSAMVLLAEKTAGKALQTYADLFSDEETRDFWDSEEETRH
jgi:hypothetical protein